MMQKGKLGMVAGDVAAMPKPFKVSYKMNLVPAEGAQTLIIDSQVPIDFLMLQSMQNIDILDVKDGVCKITKVADKISNCALLATLKVQGEQQVNRVEIKIRTSEGQVGNLLVYVVPTESPTSQLVDVELKPLNLHERVDSIAEIDQLPLSRLSLKGRFTMTDGHNWIGQCLPEVPHNVG